MKPVLRTPTLRTFSSSVTLYSCDMSSIMIGAGRNRQGSGGGVRKGGNMGGNMGVMGEIRGCGPPMALSNEGGRVHARMDQVAYAHEE